MIIVYRKSDLACVGSVPEGMTIDQEIELNVIPNFGGLKSEYGIFETEKILFHLELIGNVITIVEDVPVPIVPKLSEIEILRSDISQQNVELISQITNLQKQLNILPPITDPISLQDYQINKIYELTLACNRHILNGFYSSCRGIEEFYSCSQLDQNNIKGYIALLGVKPDLDNIIWKSASETLCTPFTAGQMIQLGSDMMHHVQDNIYKFELLRNQVMECISIEYVGAITWENII